MWKPARPLLPMATALALALALGACAATPAASEPPPSGPLVSVTTRGGECPDGACGGTTVIDRDGTVRDAAKPPNELGTVPPDILAALDAAIKTTDFDVVRSATFTGECPVNFDGQEVIYEFQAPGGLERVASCETEIDPAHPVFAAVNAALVAVEVLPAP